MRVTDEVINYRHWVKQKFGKKEHPPKSPLSMQTMDTDRVPTPLSSPDSPKSLVSSPKKSLTKQQSQGATTYAAIASRKAEVHR